MIRPDFKKMTGEELYNFYTIADQEGEISELVEMLPLFFETQEETFSFLERMIKEEKTLKAIYPGLGEKTQGEYIGSITDGALYLI